MNHLGSFYFFISLLFRSGFCSNNFDRLLMDEYDYDYENNRELIEANQSISDNIDHVMKEISHDEKLHEILFELPSIYSNNHENRLKLEMLNRILSNSLMHDPNATSYLLKLGETFDSKDKHIFYKTLLRILLNIKTQEHNSQKLGKIASKSETNDSIMLNKPHFRTKNLKEIIKNVSNEKHSTKVVVTTTIPVTIQPTEDEKEPNSTQKETTKLVVNMATPIKDEKDEKISNSKHTLQTLVTTKELNYKSKDDKDEKKPSRKYSTKTLVTTKIPFNDADSDDKDKKISNTNDADETLVTTTIPIKDDDDNKDEINSKTTKVDDSVNVNESDESDGQKSV